jgi:hypothetical protein
MKISQTNEGLKDHLREQINFLRSSAKSFDDGYEGEAKRLAVVIRALLHDTDRSVSLLNQLGMEEMSFYDTAIDYRPENLLSAHGLIMMRMGQDGAKYIPPLDDGPPSRYMNGKVPFDEWWSKTVIADLHGSRFSRGDLILSVSNKDGGAHMDPHLDEAYVDLTRNNSLGWEYQIDREEKKELSSQPELASIRQIAYEVLRSLRDEYPDCFEG